MPRKRPGRLRALSAYFPVNPPPPREIDRCCGKATWADPISASYALTKILRSVNDPVEERNGRVPGVVYGPCPHGAYHLGPAELGVPA